MKFLGITSATEQVGVALIEEGTLLWEASVQTFAAEQILPGLIASVQEAFQLPEGLGGIAVVQGPGAYTGLRMGVSLTKSLARVWQVPIVGVSTLQVLASGVGETGGALVSMMSACRDEWNVALFTGAATFPPQRLTPDFVLTKAGILRFLSQVKGPLTIQSSPFYDWRSETLGPEVKKNITMLPATSAQLSPYHVACLGRALIEQGAATPWFQVVPIYSHLPHVTTPRRYERRHGN